MTKKKLFSIEKKSRDYFYKVDNYLLRLNNGMRLTVIVNPNTKETTFGALLKAGSYFEDKIGVPQGTAHLMEHIMAGNPNAFLKTKDEYDQYSLGTKYKSPFWYNAYTSTSIIEFTANGNKSGTFRIVKFVFGMLNYPTNRFSEFIQKEKEIVLNELKQRKKEENNSHLQFMRYFFNDTYPEFGKDILGTIGSINSISINDIVKFHKEVYKKEAIILYLQTNEFPNEKLLREIIKNSRSIPQDKFNFNRELKGFNNKFRYKVFSDNQRQNIYCSINYYYKISTKKEIDYKEDRLYFFLSSLIKKVMFEYIREEAQLVYEIGEVTSTSTFDDKSRGLYFMCRNEKFVETLDKIHEVLQSKIYDYLDSQRGKRWLTSNISSYIYPSDSSLDNDAASDNAFDYLFDQDCNFDYRKAKKVVQDLTTDDLKAFTKKHLEILPYVWIETEKNLEKVEAEFKKSKFYKYYSSRSS